MKTIIFDFDGTLTKKDQNIWKMIWEDLGYSVDKNSLYSKLYVDCIINKTITRQQWFDLTVEAFKKKNLTFKNFYNICNKIELINGITKTLLALKKKNYNLIIVSGCIDYAIKFILGPHLEFFDAIITNKIEFDSKGNLVNIYPSNCDYEGKAKFINSYANYNKTNIKDILFVGNSDNDEFVYQTGCKTLCINPTKMANSKNLNVWHKTIENVNNLTQILPVIDEIFSETEIK